MHLPDALGVIVLGRKIKANERKTLLLSGIMAAIMRPKATFRDKRRRKCELPKKISAYLYRLLVEKRVHADKS